MVLPIVALRAVALARRVAATRKIARIARQGVKLEGTPFDPRAAVETIGRYNTKQLESQIAKLEEFINRRTQFVGDAKGRPIPRHEFNNYKRNIERQYNDMLDAKRKQVEKLVLPNGSTVGERMKALKEIRKMTSDFDKLFRNSTDFVSRDALHKVGDSLKKQMTTAFQQRMAAGSRRIGRQMMDSIGRPDLGDLLDELSDEQFDKLWNHTPFVDEAKHRYEESRDENNGIVFSGEQDEELENLISWARKL